MTRRRVGVSESRRRLDEWSESQMNWKGGGDKLVSAVCPLVCAGES